MLENKFSTCSDAWKRLGSPRAARLLADPDELCYLEPFIGFERTVTEAADTLKVPLDRLYFRVRRAHALGILRVVRLEPRVGRAVKRYTASADGFFVPSQLVSSGDFEALALAFDLHLERLLVHSIIGVSHRELSEGEFGVWIFRDPRGHLTIDAAFSADRP